MRDPISFDQKRIYVVNSSKTEHHKNLPSASDSGGLDQETKKPKESLGFVAICRLLSSAGFTLRMGEEGLEPPTSTL